VVTATYIVKVTTNDRIADDAASVDRNPPPDGRAALLREISEGVAALSSRHRCAAARRVHHSGISLGHLQVLWILQEHGPLPVSRLADWLGIGAPNATGLLDRMEQRGLVERVRDDEDRRVVLVRASDAGRAAVAEHDGWRAELLTRLLAPLTVEQLASVAVGMRDACAAPPADTPPGDASDASPHAQPHAPRTGAPAR
jgi:DNA-binding MarR family transcriptional regulator